MSMRGSRKFCQRGFNFYNLFLFDEEKADPNNTISRPSSSRWLAKSHLNGVCWCADDDPMLNAGLVAL